MTGYENNAAEFEEFVEKSRARWNLCILDEEKPTPGTVWSKACNESWYLLALQKVRHDEWNNFVNKAYWVHLHLGSEKPN